MEILSPTRELAGPILHVLLPGLLFGGLAADFRGPHLWFPVIHSACAVNQNELVFPFGIHFMLLLSFLFTMLLHILVLPLLLLTSRSPGDELGRSGGRQAFP